MFNSYFGYFMGNCSLSQKKKARLQNDRRFAQIFFRLYEIAMDSRYNFTGVPQSISEKMLRAALLWNGQACIFKSKEGDLICLPCAVGDDVTIYGDFAGAYVYSPNGYNDRVSLYVPGTDYSPEDAKEGHGVLIRENNAMFPFIETVYYYAEAISDSIRSIDIARKQVKIPALIACDPKMLPSVQKLFSSRDDNEEVIAISSLFPADKISTIPFAQAAAQQIPPLTSLVDWLEHRFRAECGIMANEAIDKKGENIINAEVSVNEEYTDSSTERLLQNLNTTLGQANAIFGTNIKAIEPDFSEHPERKVEKENEVF